MYSGITTTIMISIKDPSWNPSSHMTIYDYSSALFTPSIEQDDNQPPEVVG
jgi:hypothetical protein